MLDLYNGVKSCLRLLQYTTSMSMVYNIVFKVAPVYNFDDVDDEEDICVICHDGLSVRETKALECGHNFHTEVTMVYFHHCLSIGVCSIYPTVYSGASLIPTSLFSG